jgi:purine-binding chemotaxis protein CheW
LDDKILNKRFDDKKEQDDKKARILFQSIAFRLDNSIYAMDVMNIQEIIFARKIYRVPNTNERLLGVLNLRGNILPTYSLKLILGMDDESKGKNVVNEEDKFIVMIKKDRDVFGILIDSIFKNIPATEDNYRAGQNIERWSKNTFFSGVILDGENEILTIQIENLLKYIVTLK